MRIWKPIPGTPTNPKDRQKNQSEGFHNIKSTVTPRNKLHPMPIRVHRNRPPAPIRFGGRHFHFKTRTLQPLDHLIARFHRKPDAR